MTSLISIHFSGQPPSSILNYLYYQYIICMDNFCYVFSTGKSKFYCILFYQVSLHVGLPLLFPFTSFSFICGVTDQIQALVISTVQCSSVLFDNGLMNYP